jgi:hypothetical protein
MDMRAQHHHIRYLEAAQQQRQQTQIRRQHVDLQRRIGGTAALQSDVMERDVASREDRNIDAAVDDQFEPGHGADLRFHRALQRVPVEKPGVRDQADQRQTEKGRNRHPQALHSFGHRQRHIQVCLRPKSG